MKFFGGSHLQFERQLLAADKVISLVWKGDSLVDWASGNRIYHLSGKIEDPHIHWAYDFDAVKTSQDGTFSVLYQLRGTKAILLREGKILRELNRSFYFAQVYEYPVCLWTTRKGRTLIAHCPEEYNRIEIDDAVTGERLTSSNQRKPVDVFHSRLAVNPAGTRLLSAGWVWHPFNVVQFFEIDKCLADPKCLDEGVHAPGTFNLSAAEPIGACWQSEDRVIITASAEPEDDQDEDIQALAEPRLKPNGVAIYDLDRSAFTQSVLTKAKVGSMMPVGMNHVLGFYEFPKLISLETGEVTAEWTDLSTGTQTSSIVGELNIPPLALDPQHQRFAALGEGGIHVITFK